MRQREEGGVLGGGWNEERGMEKEIEKQNNRNKRREEWREDGSGREFEENRKRVIKKSRSKEADRRA